MFLRVGITFCLLITMNAVLKGALVSEDFSYPDNDVLLAKTGGSGAWDGAWGASTGIGANTSRIKIDANNLTYSGGGYAITQSGTGRAFGDFNGFRGINRYIDTNLTGTVWFSILAQNLAATDRAAIQFNTHVDAPYTGFDYTRGNFDVMISGTSLDVRYGGVNSVLLATLPIDTTHLLLGRITFQASGANDLFEVWANPADLLNLGTPLFSNNTADLGTDLYLAGIFTYGSSDVGNNRQGYLDALRISDGGGNSAIAFSEVTGVIPEPSTLMLLGLSGVGAALWVRKRYDS